MDDADPVGAGERGGELPAERDDPRLLERLSFQQRREALPLDVLHHHEGAAVVLDDVVDGGHVRMRDAGRHARFADDAIAQVPAATPAETRHFSATGRSRRESRARKTSPMPPRPSRCTTT